MVDIDCIGQAITSIPSRAKEIEIHAHIKTGIVEIGRGRIQGGYSLFGELLTAKLQDSLIKSTVLLTNVFVLSYRILIKYTIASSSRYNINYDSSPVEACDV